MEEIEPMGFKESPVDQQHILEGIAETNGISAVTLLRIYDVLMCLYGDVNIEDAKQLAELHNNGKLRSNMPWLDTRE